MKQSQLDYMMSKAEPDCDLCHGRGRVLYKYPKNDTLPNGCSYWGTCWKCCGIIYAVPAPPRKRASVGKQEKLI